MFPQDTHGSRTRRWVLVLCVGVFAAACEGVLTVPDPITVDESVHKPDGGTQPDAGAVTGAPDAGRASDAGTSADAGVTPTIPHEGQVQGGLLLGAYSDGFGDSVPSTVASFVTLVGKRPQIVMWYQDWVNNESTFNAALMDSNTAGGSVAEITWEPHDWNGAANQPAFALSQILAGNYDPYIHTFAKASAAYRKPFFIRFMHEMNGGWYSWSPDVNGNTPAQYVAVWKHVVDIFRAEGATNVRWMWTPNIDDGGYPAMAKFYPGDDYVDWIGLDGYNTGTAESWSTWESLQTLFQGSYNQLSAVTASKPMIIAETASDSAGGDKAAWITQGYLTTVPQRFPHIQAMSWFDVNKEHDWRVDSDSASLAAYRAVCASSTYAGTLGF